jgi:hypothetical protein
MAFIINLSQLIFVTALFFAFSLRSGQQRVKKWLQTAMLLSLFAAFSNTLNDFLKDIVSTIDGDSEALISLGRIFFAGGYFMIYIFFEGGMNEKPPSKRLIAYSAVAGVSIATSIIYGFDSHNYTGWVAFVGDISRRGLGVIVFGYATYALNRVRKVTHELSASLQTLGALIMSIGFFFELFSTPFLSPNEDVLVLIYNVSNVVIGVGLALLLVIYAINPVYVQRIPVQVCEIMVYTRGGLHLNSVKVSTRGFAHPTEFDSYLVSGLATALSGFIKQITGSERELEIIKTVDRVVYFDLGERISFSIIAEKITQVIIDSLTKLRQQYETHMIITKFVEPMNDELFIKLIQDIYPYLDIIAPESTATLGNAIADLS